MSDPIGSSNPPEGSATDAAKEQASALASKVQEQGSRAADSLQHGGQQVVGEAKAQVGKLSEEAQRQLHVVLGHAQEELGDRAAAQTDKAAANLRGLAGELRALAEGRPDEASSLVPYVRQVSETAADYADRLDSGGFSGIADDLSNFARRRPGVFLLGALAAGFVTARLVRGAQKTSASKEASDAALPSGGPQPEERAPLPDDVLLGTPFQAASAGELEVS